MRTPVVLLAGAALQLAGAWVTLPSDYHEWEGRKYAWPSPSDPLSDVGLAGGIAFAVDPAFCSTMRPVFREDAPGEGSFNMVEFITCGDISDALARAMTTWSLNHPYIKFYDVTDECIVEGKGRECSAAEVYIDAGAPAANSDLQSIAAYVVHNPSWRSYDGDQWETGVRMPSGDVSPKDWEIKFATLTFHNHLCWYLDNTFCSKFRAYDEAVGDVQLAMSALTWSVWGTAFVYLLYRAVGFLLNVHRRGLTDGVKITVSNASHMMVPNYVCLLFIISPPIFWYKIFVPCVECYDFEATAAHEVGHVLGFTHPDVYPQFNRVATRQASEDNCCIRSAYPAGDRDGSDDSVGQYAWMEDIACDHGNATYSKDAVAFDAQDSDILNSIMFHLTTVRSRACLSGNDLDGLHFHYPVCDDALIHQTDPICVKARRNIGYVRLIEAVVPPFVVASFILFLGVATANHHQRAETNQNRWLLAARVSASLWSRRARGAGGGDVTGTTHSRRRWPFQRSVAAGRTTPPTLQATDKNKENWEASPEQPRDFRSSSAVAAWRGGLGAWGKASRQRQAREIDAPPQFAGARVAFAARNTPPPTCDDGGDDRGDSGATPRSGILAQWRDYREHMRRSSHAPQAMQGLGGDEDRKLAA